MKYVRFCVALFIFVFIQSCAPKWHNYSRYLTCTATDYNLNKSDTTQIVYEALLRTIAEQAVPDFGLIKDKKNIFILNTYFKPFCSDQDTSEFQRFKEVPAVPYKIGNNRFCLKSINEIRNIANLEKKCNGTADWLHHHK